tara:strand:- start:36 stop:404 length:369 start_codon:yes stop_codon:yes gene_type:complete
MTSSKTEDKIIGMSLSTLLDMASEIEAEKTAFVESLRDELVGTIRDYQLIELLCDGLSVAVKLLREVEGIVENNPIFKPKDREGEQVVLFSDDRKILEMIMLSRTQTKTDLRRFKNVSVFMH